MRVEFASPDDEQKATLATAEWDDGSVTISSEDEELRTKLAHAFRRTPVVIDDPSYRRLGTSGSVVLQPGDLAWFRAVAVFVLSGIVVSQAFGLCSPSNHAD